LKVLRIIASTNTASIMCLLCWPDHRVPSAGLVDDIRVHYRLGDLEAIGVY